MNRRPFSGKCKLHISENLAILAVQGELRGAGQSTIHRYGGDVCFRSPYLEGAVWPMKGGSLHVVPPSPRGR